MIQRIQTFWLFLVFAIAIGLAHLFQKENILLIASALTAALAVVGIIRYKDRPRQITICYILIFLEAVTAVVMYLKLVPIVTEGESALISPVWLPIAPVFGLIFAVLAMTAIKKDEKLVRSMDRLR
ncbi:hypothetical protein AGMMS49525_15290 [Bacteroidia bacterium]|nr:hypothetical protein AGMMS49525_15290 [Bacteroidia bacterium]